MTKWPRRVRAALGMGLLWAVGGVAVAAVLETLDNIAPATHPVTRLVDMWPQALAILGFFLGVIFAIVLGVVGRRRRFDEFSLGEFTAWGVLSGLVLGAVGMLAFGAGPLFLVITTLLSTIGGASSLVVARMAEGRGLLGSGERSELLERGN